MKKQFLIAAFIILLTLTQLVSAQDGPVTIPSPAEPQQTAVGPTYEEQVLEIVNQERWKDGQRPPLKGNQQLNNAAETHSNNMAVRNFFAHCDLDTKTTPAGRAQAAGYASSYVGENIAAGYGTPASVMVGWMNSPGHKGNILNTNYREIGIGYVYQSDDQANIRTDAGGCVSDGGGHGPYRSYWTQNFGKVNDVYPVVINREAYETETRQVNLYMYGAGWATQMRFRNENGVWSSWQAYQTDAAWTLSAGNGTKTVNAEIRNSSGTVKSASDTIQLNGTGPTLSVSPGKLAFALQQDGPLSQTTTITIQNTGQEAFNWTLTGDGSWLTVSADSGTVSADSSTTINVTASRNGLSLGLYNKTLTIDAGSADNSPQMVNVSFLVTDVPPVFLPMVTK
ncbi:MAG: hypothetical protein IAF02_13780 [Anaerolineae bacterium]|nr:hypothetical protein [Anaerolineae bacterium]